MEDLQALYDNSAVRRRDRLLDFGRAMEILEQGEYGFLAIGGESGYGLPLNYVLWDGRICFHCAPEGEKLRRLAANNWVCFCVVGHTAPEPSKFTTEYESVLVFGRIAGVTDERLRMQALGKIVEKYSPGFTETGRRYAEKSFHRTAVLCLQIERVSGKRKYLSRTEK